MAEINKEIGLEDALNRIGNHQGFSVSKGIKPDGEEEKLGHVEKLEHVV